MTSKIKREVKDRKYNHDQQREIGAVIYWQL